MNKSDPTLHIHHSSFRTHHSSMRLPLRPAEAGFRERPRAEDDRELAEAEALLAPAHARHARVRGRSSSLAPEAPARRGSPPRPARPRSPGLFSPFTFASGAPRLAISSSITELISPPTRMAAPVK